MLDWMDLYMYLRSLVLKEHRQSDANKTQIWGEPVSDVCTLSRSSSRAVVVDVRNANRKTRSSCLSLSQSRFRLSRPCIGGEQLFVAEDEATNGFPSKETVPSVPGQKLEFVWRGRSILTQLTGNWSFGAEHWHQLALIHLCQRTKNAPEGFVAPHMVCGLLQWSCDRGW